MELVHVQISYRLSTFRCTSTGSCGNAVRPEYEQMTAVVPHPAHPATGQLWAEHSCKVAISTSREHSFHTYPVIHEDNISR